MGNHAKKRRRKLAAEMGVSSRTAANIIAKRTACSRGGHVANREPFGTHCTDCGAALAPSKGPER